MFVDKRIVFHMLLQTGDLSVSFDFHINLEWRQVENLPLNISENILENTS